MKTQLVIFALVLSASAIRLAPTQFLMIEEDHDKPSSPNQDIPAQVPEPPTEPKNPKSQFIQEGLMRPLTSDPAPPVEEDSPRRGFIQDGPEPNKNAGGDMVLEPLLGNGFVEQEDGFVQGSPAEALVQSQSGPPVSVGGDLAPPVEEDPARRGFIQDGPEPNKNEGGELAPQPLLGNGFVEQEDGFVQSQGVRTFVQEGPTKPVGGDQAPPVGEDSPRHGFIQGGPTVPVKGDLAPPVEEDPARRGFIQDGPEPNKNEGGELAPQPLLGNGFVEQEDGFVQGSPAEALVQSQGVRTFVQEGPTKPVGGDQAPPVGEDSPRRGFIQDGPEPNKNAGGDMVLEPLLGNGFVEQEDGFIQDTPELGSNLAGDQTPKSQENSPKHGSDDGFVQSETEAGRLIQSEGWGRGFVQSETEAARLIQSEDGKHGFVQSETDDKRLIQEGPLTTGSEIGNNLPSEQCNSPGCGQLIQDGPTKPGSGEQAPPAEEGAQRRGFIETNDEEILLELSARK